MRKLKFSIHILLLFTIPTLFAFPRRDICFTSSKKSPFKHSTSHEDSCSFTYDKIINLLEEIEYGELDKKCSQTQLEQINQFLAPLATEGILPNDVEEENSITEDIEELLEGRENPLNPSLQESLKKYKQAQKSLSAYIKKPLPENIIRNHICDTGIQTLPKPQGIPSNYIARITEKGAGMKYVHPNNPHISIRVMPGKPHSPYPYQQKPYVVQMKNGKAIDKYGNPVNKRLPEAHIPLEEFKYTP